MDSVEHILLESDDRHVPDVRAARKVHARAVLRSYLRRWFLQLEIIDYYYLSVRSHARSAKLEYVLDLRFVDMPRTSQHVSWRWITASLSLTGLAYGTTQLGPSVLPWSPRNWLIVCAAVSGAWAVATLMAVYRTTETVTLFSTDGAARLLACTGGFGTLRGGARRRFMAKIAAHVQLAAAARRVTKAAHLRDAMREHFRLRELGVLDEPTYESAKARILGTHSPTSGSYGRARA
ncbi:MAG TPA: hypothetical protein VGI35_08905 [Steroidobacteraceae bacterium]